MGRLVTEGGGFLLTTESGVVLVTEGYAEDDWITQPGAPVSWETQEGGGSNWTTQTPASPEWEIS